MASTGTCTGKPVLKGASIVSTTSPSLSMSLLFSLSTVKSYMNPTASMTITQYLGTGSTSRGRMTITRQLNTVVSTPPYLRTDEDKAAVIKGLVNLQESLKDAGFTWVNPKPGVSAEQFVNSVGFPELTFLV